MENYFIFVILITVLILIASFDPFHNMNCYGQDISASKIHVVNIGDVCSRCLYTLASTIAFLFVSPVSGKRFFKSPPSAPRPAKYREILFHSCT